jgi:hypothetical protein
MTSTASLFFRGTSNISEGSIMEHMGDFALLVESTETLQDQELNLDPACAKSSESLGITQPQQSHRKCTATVGRPYNRNANRQESVIDLTDSPEPKYASIVHCGSLRTQSCSNAAKSVPIPQNAEMEKGASTCTLTSYELERIEEYSLQQNHRKRSNSSGKYHPNLIL